MSSETLRALAGILVSMTYMPGPSNAMLGASGANYSWRLSMPHGTGAAIGFPPVHFDVALGLARPG